MSDYNGLDEGDIFDFLRDNLVLEGKLIDGHVRSVQVTLKLQYPFLKGEYVELGSEEILIPDPER